MTNDNRAVTAYDNQSDLALPTDTGDFIGQSASAAPRMSLGQVVHRSLRGRYWLVIPLSLMMGFTGALAGWKFFSAKYRSIGQIQIQYEVPTIGEDDQVKLHGKMDLYEEYVNTQTLIIQSQRIIGLAMREPTWIKTGRGADQEAMKKFMDNLTVEHPIHTQSITISLLDKDPAIAAAGVRSIVRIYSDYFQSGDKDNLDVLMKSLEDKVKEKQRNINEVTLALDEIVKSYGTQDFTDVIKTEQDQLSAHKKALDSLVVRLDSMIASGNPAKLMDQMTDVQIGMLSPAMANKIDAIETARAHLAKMRTQYGESHPAVISAESAVEEAQRAAQEYATQWRSLKSKLVSHGLAFSDAPTEGGSQSSGSSDVGSGIAMTQEALKAQIDSLKKLAQDRYNAMAAASANARQVEKLQDQLKTYQKDWNDAKAELANYRNSTARNLSRLIVLTAGEEPIQPFKDPRKPAAAGLGVFGLILPFALFLGIGVSDRRFRFSDQADRNTAGLPPLLGILPTLPEKLSDPEQAAVAAHCVHQLRIMLQVNTANTPSADGNSVPQRKAYVITSASPGDGKTSLTMALGLSYAASGSRTLVIDCDMVGQGLTQRLKAGESEGLLEALEAGTLAGRVKKTTTPNLYILPIGGADSAHAGALSPQSIRKLLTEARRIFDVIVVDTGPILGSLEAQVVSAAADSVIMTIARGQQQPLVQKALRMLRNVGANVGGMVFNRAQQRDFEKSVTSSSMKSVSSVAPTRRALLSEGAEESRFGPLARSVASFMPSRPGAKVAPKPSAQQTPDGIRVEVVSRDADDTDEGADDTVHGEAYEGENP